MTFVATKVIFHYVVTTFYMYLYKITNTYGEETSVTALEEKLDWPTLQERRRKGRLNDVYKIINDHIDIDHTKWPSSFNQNPTGPEEAKTDRYTLTTTEQMPILKLLQENHQGNHCKLPLTKPHQTPSRNPLSDIDIDHPILQKISTTLLHTSTELKPYTGVLWTRDFGGLPTKYQVQCFSKTKQLFRSKTIKQLHIYYGPATTSLQEVQ